MNAQPNEPAGQDPEKGKLFEVPRVKVAVDESDPTVIKLSFSGSIELDRAARTRHRRDSDEVAHHHRHRDRLNAWPPRAI